MISDEGHVVDPPCCLKGFLLEKRKERRERGDGEREEKESGEREEPAWDGEKGLVRDWSGKTMNAGGVEK
ncbi:hypothetical protein TNCV_2830671 [Trichonephila clavipes]|nr:hypothetical protein TNCV_2830671 [Trichonephila clavipes]